MPRAWVEGGGRQCGGSRILRRIWLGPRGGLLLAAALALWGGGSGLPAAAQAADLTPPRIVFSRPADGAVDQDAARLSVPSNFWLAVEGQMGSGIALRFDEPLVLPPGDQWSPSDSTALIRILREEGGDPVAWSTWVQGDELALYRASEREPALRPGRRYEVLVIGATDAAGNRADTLRIHFATAAAHDSASSDTIGAPVSQGDSTGTAPDSLDNPDSAPPGAAPALVRSFPADGDTVDPDLVNGTGPDQGMLMVFSEPVQSTDPPFLMDTNGDTLRWSGILADSSRELRIVRGGSSWPRVRPGGHYTVWVTNVKDLDGHTAPWLWFEFFTPGVWKDPVGSAGMLVDIWPAPGDTVAVTGTDTLRAVFLEKVDRRPQGVLRDKASPSETLHWISLEPAVPADSNRALLVPATPADALRPGRTYYIWLQDLLLRSDVSSRWLNFVFHTAASDAVSDTVCGAGALSLSLDAAAAPGDQSQPEGTVGAAAGSLQVQIFLRCDDESWPPIDTWKGRLSFDPGTLRLLRIEAPEQAFQSPVTVHQVQPGRVDVEIESDGSTRPASGPARWLATARFEVLAADSTEVRLTDSRIVSSAGQVFPLSDPPPVIFRPESPLPSPSADTGDTTIAPQLLITRQDPADSVRAGSIVTAELRLLAAPSFVGWSARCEFVPEEVAYVAGSFTPGPALSDLRPRVDTGTGFVEISGSLSSQREMPADDDVLGTLQFRVQPGFKETTLIRLAQASLFLADGDKLDLDCVPSAAIFLSRSGDMGTAISRETAGGAVPRHAGLGPAFPNPFNAVTTVVYAVTRPGPVRLDIYSLSGTLVRHLWSGVSPAGNFRVAWDGRDDQGNPVGSGVYLIRLRGTAFRDLGKVTLLK